MQTFSLFSGRSTTKAITTLHSAYTVMDVAAVVGVIGLLLISYYVFFSFIKRGGAGHGRKPPVAAGCWPLIGHLYLFGGSTKPPYETLGALADKYGAIFSIHIGLHPAVVVNTWELAKECFTTLDLFVSSRPKYTATKILGYDYANFGFSPYGDFWREMHKITVSELLSSRRFELLHDIRDSEVQGSLKELYRASAEKIGGSGDLLVEMNQWFGVSNLNVILRMIAGKRYTSGNEQQVRRLQGVLREFLRLTGLFVVGDAIPALGWLDFGGQVKEMKNTAIEMDSIVGEWLEEHRRKRESGETKTEQDFIDVLLSVIHHVHLAGYDAETVIKATCSALIVGAADTTISAMIWGLSLLLNNRHALKKVQDELDEHVGKERLVNDSDVNKLVYLQAVVKETLRLYPPAPLSGPREFTEDCTLGGYHIQANTRLILNLWKLHRDPRVWSEPLEFRPERFLDTHKGVDVKGRHFELLPFGSGRRSCPGLSFGLQMTHLALATFLQAFEVTTPSNAQVDMSATFGLTIMKATPLEVLIKPRLSQLFLFRG
ncbi:cytochrome P450 CYP82D47-like [Abrus precatorius]|uniref:Cytochrome P450 CYP82D47-like n=1 Tax=Abrus precatorius TaxID=3816 RepID=A0A8B8LG34_ABRPR|nr:cytochrome P450 CYP82D47-like [Abrus precatorius]